jgi:ankyrin repeat protein
MGGYTELVAVFVSKGANVNSEDRWGWTPLHYACSKDHKDTVEFLLSKGADLNAREEERKTPIMVAKGEGHNDVVELLRQHGAIESLHDAVIIEDPNGLESMIAKGADVNAKDENGQAPLHVAVCRGSKKMAELLLKKGARIEALDKFGQTPLYDAVDYQKLEVARLLLDRGADVRATMTSGDTALDAAVAKGYKEMAELLLAHGAAINGEGTDRTPIHEAMKTGQEDMVGFLTAKGADIPTVHAAAYFGRVDQVKELLASGVDINARDKTRFTPLHCAACGNRTDMAEYLIGKGADVNASDRQDSTPLHYAIDAGLREMTELLLAKGAKVNLKDKAAQTALLEATYDGFSGKMKLDWQILHPDPSHWSLSKNAGMLTITTQDGAFDRGRTDYKNVFLIDCPATPGMDFQMTTCISAFQPVADWNQAGLICWNNENEFLKLVYEWHSLGGNAERVFAVVAETQESGDIVFRTSAFRADQQLQGVWLRLTKRGDRYTFSTSTGGRSFVPLESPPIYDAAGFSKGGIQWGTGTVKQVGIVAYNGSKLGAPEIDALFDCFEVRVLPPE